MTRSDMWRRVAVSLTAACLLVLGCLYSFFMDRNPEFDELVLGNPVHMYLHSARMTYPAHGQWDYMVVHPPTHYVVIANVMRATGLDLFQAAGVPVFLFFVCSIGLIAGGRFTLNVKLGLMFGLYAAIFVWGHYRPVRPDLHVAAAWLCGLVVFETARLTGWTTWRLGAGALLVSYASALHYPASFAFLSGVVFAIWCIRDIGWRAARSRVLVMALAALCVAVPYFWWFVWPLSREILAFVRVVGEATFTSPWKLHVATYSFWWNHPELPGALFQWEHRPITAALTAPLLALSVPAAIVGPLLLSRESTARGIAFAAIPHLAFVLFLVGGQGKNETNTGYYVTEMIFYLAGATTMLLVLLGRVPSFWTSGGPQPWTAFMPALLISAAALVDVPNSMAHRFAVTPRLAYEDLLRGIGREMLGPGSAVGSSSPSMWRHSGASLFYFVMPDLLYPDDVSGVDLRRYFSRFDAMGIAPDSSGVTWNQQRKSLTEWYADGLLKLRGFVLAGGTLSYLLLGPEHTQPVRGFAYDHERKRLWRFTESEPANATLVLFHGPSEPIAREPALNDSTWGYQTFKMASDQRGLQGTDILQAVLVPTAQLERAAAGLAKYRVVEQFRGRVEADDIAARLKHIDSAGPVEIPRTLAEVEARRAHASGAPLAAICEPLLPGARQMANGIRVSLPRAQWEPVCRTNGIPMTAGTSYRVSFKLDISRGGVAVNVMSPALKQYTMQWSRRYPQKLWQEGFVFTANDSTAFITIAAYNERPDWSVFEVRDLEIEPVALR